MVTLVCGLWFFLSVEIWRLQCGILGSTLAAESGTFAPLRWRSMEGASSGYNTLAAPRAITGSHFSVCIEAEQLYEDLGFCVKLGRQETARPPMCLERWGS